MKRSTTLGAVAVCLALLVGACGSGSTPGASNALVVEGRTLSMSELDAELSYLRDHPSVAQNLVGSSAPEQGQTDQPGRAEWDMQAGNTLLSLHIFVELMAAVGAGEGVELSDEDLDAGRSTLDELAGAFDPTTGQATTDPDALDAMPERMQGDLVQVIAWQFALERHLQATQDTEVTDQDVRDAYDEAIGDGSDFADYACVSHILIAFGDEPPAPGAEPPAEVDEAARAQAEAAVERLDAGEGFAEVAMELSDDPSNAAAGGDLDCNFPGTFVPEFEEALYALEPGTYSDPVRTQFGYHVILLRSLGPPTFDDVADEIRAGLEQQAADVSMVFLELIERAAGDLDVEVNPRLGTWDAEQMMVVPPEGAEPAPNQVGGDPLTEEELFAEIEGIDPEVFDDAPPPGG